MSFRDGRAWGLSEFSSGLKKPEAGRMALQNRVGLVLGLRRGLELDD